MASFISSDTRLNGQTIKILLLALLAGLLLGSLLLGSDELGHYDEDGDTEVSLGQAD